MKNFSVLPKKNAIGDVPKIGPEANIKLIAISNIDCPIMQGQLKGKRWLAKSGIL